MMWGWDGGPSGWGWFWMIVMMSFVWLPLIVAAAWALLQLGRRANGGREGGEGGDARALARRAYARGELDRERYLQIMEDLEQGSARKRRAQQWNAIRYAA